MKKFTAILTIVCLMIAGSAFSQHNWRVNNAFGIDADFTAIQAAVDSAEPGDIIYVEGTNIPYNGAAISKQLNFYGPGYFLASNDSTQANVSAATISGTLTLQSGAEGSYLAGLTISMLNVSASNVIIERNNITTLYIANSHDVGNVLIRQNYIYIITDGSYYSSAVIQNNILTGTVSSSVRASWLIYNNSIKGNNYGFIISVYNSSIKNNIVENEMANENYTCINTDVTMNNNIQFNICNKVPYNQPVPANNLWGTDMTQVITGTGNNETRFYLIEGSLASGYGENGVDCGAFGNNTPYILSGMPPIPHIFNASVPVSATTTGGLPVNVKIKSQK